MVEKNFDEAQVSDEYPFQGIVEKAIQGDEKAFKQIYDLLGGRMYSLCIRYAGDTSEANDMFQEGFIRVYRCLDAYKGTGAFEGWVRKIFINTCLSYLRNRQRLLYSELHSDGVEYKTTELTGIDRLSSEELIDIIHRLPTGFKLIVNLHLVEGYSHKEISELLGIAVGTSKSQLSRARLLLKKEIQQKHG